MNSNDEFSEVSQILNKKLFHELSELNIKFKSATPFKHVVYDSFFSESFVDKLIDEFPEPNGELKNEFGEPSLKHNVTDVKNISPVYAQLDRYIQSSEFLRLIESITGVEGLIYDPDYFGGGTHNNLAGQGMDPHVDFNVLETSSIGKVHRRLNGIVYLNEDWDDSWGGALDLHFNPFDPQNDYIKRVFPKKNKLVLFETNEHSYHGFLPVNKNIPQGTSRKSFAMYFYTKDRPSDEIVPKHGTFYVPRIPVEKFKIGRKVSKAISEELIASQAHALSLIKNLNKKEIAASAYLDDRLWEIKTLEQQAHALLEKFDFEVTDWGPKDVEGANINYQPDGNVGIWIKHEAPKVLGKFEILFNGKPCHNLAVDGNLITASVPMEEIGAPGTKAVYIKTELSPRLFYIGIFGSSGENASLGPENISQNEMIQSHDYSYQERLKQELQNYKHVENVHELPAIFHYWSENHLKPIFEASGVSGVENLFASKLYHSLPSNYDGCPTFLSVGSGNCDTEIIIAGELKKLGLKNFKFQNLDINKDMLSRGAEAAKQCGLEDSFEFVCGDFNSWVPNQKYNGVIANQSLHHVVELEHLFAQIKSSLTDNGVFVVSDMIGRNGHQRWPEAYEIVKEVWKTLPTEKKYNHLLRRFEETYENWDCSKEGFEGIRSEDILYLLNENFHCQWFVGFGNIVDIFVDRCFGHNYDPNSKTDQKLIDKLHEKDEEGFASGKLTPTHMMGVFSNNIVVAPHYSRNISPASILAIRNKLCKKHT